MSFDIDCAGPTTPVTRRNPAPLTTLKERTHVAEAITAFNRDCTR